MRLHFSHGSTQSQHWQTWPCIFHKDKNLDFLFVLFQLALFVQLTNWLLRFYSHCYLLLVQSRMVNSSHPEVFYKKGVLRNFAKFTGKHLRQSLFFTKICRYEASNFIKNETLAQTFSYRFCEISKNTFFTEHRQATASVWFCLSKLEKTIK